MIRTAPIALLLSLAACAGPDSLKTAQIVLERDGVRTPIAVGECIQNQFLLKNNFPLELASDEHTGRVRVTLVQRDAMILSGGVWYWQGFIAPRDGGKSRIVVRSNSNMWGYVISDDTLSLIKACTEAPPSTVKSE